MFGIIAYYSLKNSNPFLLALSSSSNVLLGSKVNESICLMKNGAKALANGKG